MTNWIFRKESAESLTGKAWRLHAEKIEEWSPRRRRWRVGEGDRLVVTSNRGLQLRFLALYTVLALSWTEEASPIQRDREGYRLEIHVELSKELPVDLTLERFMYSLERVANLSRPASSFRHHGRLSDTDVATLESGEVHARRSLFFGILRSLPPKWRAYFETRAHAHAAQDALAQRERWDVAEHPPFVELWSDIWSQVAGPALNGARVSAIFDRLGETFAYPLAETEDGNVDTFSLSRFLAMARIVAQSIREQSELIQPLFAAAAQERSGEQLWRIQRW